MEFNPLRKMNANDLEMVLSWRNHADIRRYMYTSREIGWSEHQAWFEKASKDPLRHLLIYEENGAALGVVNLHEIAPGGIADWGFYTRPEAPKGTGSKLGAATLKYAFTDKGFHRLYGEVLSSNQSSISFHERLGFRLEGVLREHFYDGKEYLDIMCFGLLADDSKV